MSNKIELIVHGVVNGPVHIQTGDCIDLGDAGLLVFYGGKEAEAIRLLQQVNKEKVRSAIEFTKQKMISNQ